MALPTDLLNELDDEHDFAITHFEPFHSAHEGLSIIQEEYEELKQEVFKKAEHREISQLRTEAIHLATMALRFIVDICGEK